MALLLAPLAASPVDALYVSGSLRLTAHATGASFDVAVSPAPAADRRGQNVRLTWTAVTISSGDIVGYSVLRHGPSAEPVAVCTEANAPVTSGSTVTCMDRRPGTNASYTVRAYVTGPDGSPTWSLPVSASVAP